MRRLAILVLLPTLAALAASGRPVAAASTTTGIIATFDVVGETFRAHIENPATIQQVIDLWNGQSTANIPNGKLVAGEEYNTGWSWHMDPWDIEMAEATIELCDGLPSHVESNLDYWLNVVGRYCPWSAVLIEVRFLGVVGGTTELVEASSDFSASGSASGGLSTADYAAIAGGAAGAALALTAGAWYARRRWLR